MREDVIQHWVSFQSRTGKRKKKQNQKQNSNKQTSHKKNSNKTTKNHKQPNYKTPANSKKKVLLCDTSLGQFGLHHD